MLVINDYYSLDNRCTEGYMKHNSTSIVFHQWNSLSNKVCLNSVKLLFLFYLWTNFFVQICTSLDLFCGAGCDGGFRIWSGGKYAEDFGLVDETCNPYKGQTEKCTTPPTCHRYYATNYHYIGGFYGGYTSLFVMFFFRSAPAILGY